MLIKNYFSYNKRQMTNSRNFGPNEYIFPLTFIWWNFCNRV